MRKLCALIINTNVIWGCLSGDVKFVTILITQMFAKFGKQDNAAQILNHKRKKGSVTSVIVTLRQ